MAMLASIIGKARAVNFRKLNSTPAFSARPAATRFGLAPTSVPLPPRQAPRASDHQMGKSAWSPPKAGARLLIRGIMVATNGILSTMAERMADPHRTAVAASREL